MINWGFDFVQYLGFTNPPYFSDLWKDANNQGDNRLEDLKKNLQAWESYENKRNQLDDQLNQANGEFTAIVRVYDLEEGPKDHSGRLATASKMRKQIEETFKVLDDANNELAKLLEDDKKQELADEVTFIIACFLFPFSCAWNNATRVCFQHFLNELHLAEKDFKGVRYKE